MQWQFYQVYPARLFERGLKRAGFAPLSVCCTINPMRYSVIAPCAVLREASLWDGAGITENTPPRTAA